MADWQFLVGEGGRLTVLVGESGRLAEAQTEIVYEEGKAKFFERNL